MSDFPIIDSTAAQMIATMDRIGIDLIVASGCPGLFGQAEIGNDIVRDAMRCYPHRIFGYMTVDIGRFNSLVPEMQRRLEEGFHGIKIWSRGSRQGLPYYHPNYRTVFEFAQRNELPILAHTWGKEIGELRWSFKEYPNIKWLLAHTGSVDMEKYLDAAITYDNVFLETCLSACPRGLIERLVRSAPLHKIIWGTDQAFLNAAHQIGRVLFAEITPSQKKAILGQNAEAFFRSKITS